MTIIQQSLFGHLWNKQRNNHMHSLNVFSVYWSVLFVIVMEALSREFRVALPWELLYADDLVVIAEIEDGLHCGP